MGAGTDFLAQRRRGAEEERYTRRVEAFVGCTAGREEGKGGTSAICFFLRLCVSALNSSVSRAIGRFLCAGVR